MSHWEKQLGPTLYYCDVYTDEVVVGKRSASSHSDVAGSCTHRAFLEGKYQKIVLSHLGKSVLLEVLKCLGGSQADQKLEPQSVVHSQ